MIDVTAFNWTYWLTSGELFIAILAVTVMPVVVVYGFKTDRLLPKNVLMPLIIMVTIVFWGHAYFRLTEDINKFEKNKRVFSGKLCGFKMKRSAYIICVADKKFHSNGYSKGLRNDAISNFNWTGQISKPKGCVEIEYLDYGVNLAKEGYPVYREVVIGRLREIACR